MISGTRSPTSWPAQASPSTFLSPITDKGEETDELIPRIAARFPRARILRYPNRGRDVLPFVHLVNAGVLDGYRAVCKVHTKRSPHREDGDHWRRHLIAGILPEGCTATTLARFLAMPEAAVWVADGQHYRSPEWWGSNRATVAAPAGASRDPGAGRTRLSRRVRCTG